MQINTLKFKDMVSKSVKGATNDKILPITSLMCIELANNKLTLTTTDGMNYLKIMEDKVDGEDFYVVVQAEIFSKLISKITTERISLKLKETTLEVKGNGTYNIELPLDETGSLIRYPMYKFDTAVNSETINLSTIQLLLNTNKASLAITSERPELTGYYCDSNRVITTDNYKVCNTEIPVFSSPALLPASLVNLVSLMTEEKITVQRSGKKILFTTSNVVVYGISMDEIEDYPAEAVAAFLSTEFHSQCKLPRLALLSVLDRILLFVTDYDDSGIYLTFTKDGLMLNSKKETGVELITYQGSTNFQPFTCCASIRLLHSLVTAQTEDTFDMWYGHQQAIKMTFGKITQIMALFEDTRAGTDGTTSS